jgi:hypothetical protein
MYERKFVPLKKISLHKKQEIRSSPEFDFNKSCHILEPDGTFTVNIKKDGKDLKSHLEGIKQIKQELLKGNKIMPPLVFEKPDGTYEKLDGFKRLKAYTELNYENVEVITCTIPGEKLDCMECRQGGQHYTKYPNLLEGNEGVRPRDTVLSRAKAGNLRLELRENIHMHWGDKGRWRIVMGRRDFLEFSKAIIDTRLQ